MKHQPQSFVGAAQGDIYKPSRSRGFPLQPPSGNRRRNGRRASGNGDLGELSKQELDERAKAAGSEGRSKMTKAELVRALRRAA